MEIALNSDTPGGFKHENGKSDHTFSCYISSSLIKIPFYVNTKRAKR